MNQLKYLYEKDYPVPVPYGDISLYQIGTAHCEKSTRVPAHMHADFFELSIVTAGKGTITTNGVPTAVKENDIYLSFSHEEHQLDSDPDSPLRYDFCAFTVENEAFAQELLSFTNVRANLHNRVLHNDTIGGLLQAALSETSLARSYAQQYLELLFAQILIQLIRSLRSQNTNCTFLLSKDEELCYQMMYYINTHIGELDSLGRLTEIFHYDYNYLTSIFSKTTKQTLSSYHRARRLAAAAQLIKSNNLSLTEIADRLHYSSLFAFSKAFKNQYGISPRAYAAQNLPPRA